MSEMKKLSYLAHVCQTFVYLRNLSKQIQMMFKGFEEPTFIIQIFDFLASFAQNQYVSYILLCNLTARYY